MANNKLKRYLLYAFGELFLIVAGILVALYINNENASSQYEKQIDNNFLRVYSELGKNIEETIETIEKIKEKDSLIFLVMNDSIAPEMYYTDLNLAYLILYFHNLNLEDKAYQNLISLNVSDHRYKDTLLADLKDLYGLNEYIEDSNQRMSAFVYDKSIPMIAENTTSFGDLTYKALVKKDVVDFLISSEEYKSYVSQYAIIAIKNQLRHNQNFLKKALRVYAEIANEYKWENELLLANDSSYTTFTGKYVNTQSRDTLDIVQVNDSLKITRNKNLLLNLVPISPNTLFSDNEGGGFFVSFYTDDKENKLIMKLNLLSNRYFYEKME